MKERAFISKYCVKRVAVRKKKENYFHSNSIKAFLLLVKRKYLAVLFILYIHVQF